CAPGPRRATPRPAAGVCPTRRPGPARIFHVRRWTELRETRGGDARGGGMVERVERASGHGPVRPVAGAAARAPVWALAVYGVLVLVSAVIGLRREAGLPTAPRWSVRQRVVALALAIGRH